MSIRHYVASRVDNLLTEVGFYTSLSSTEDRLKVIGGLKNENWGNPVVNGYMRLLVTAFFHPDQRLGRKRLEKMKWY